MSAPFAKTEERITHLTLSMLANVIVERDKDKSFSAILDSTDETAFDSIATATTHTLSYAPVKPPLQANERIRIDELSYKVFRVRVSAGECIAELIQED